MSNVFLNPEVDILDRLRGPVPSLMAMRDAAVEIENLRRALDRETEACALLADAHKGAAARNRRAKGNVLAGLPEEAQLEILAEERGEDLASGEIAKAIRNRTQGRKSWAA